MLHSSIVQFLYRMFYTTLQSWCNPVQLLRGSGLLSQTPPFWRESSSAWRAMWARIPPRRSCGARRTRRCRHVSHLLITTPPWWSGARCSLMTERTRVWRPTDKAAPPPAPRSLFRVSPPRMYGYRNVWYKGTQVVVVVTSIPLSGWNKASR